MIIQMDRSQIPSRKPFHNLYIQKLGRHKSGPEVCRPIKPWSSQHANSQTYNDRPSPYLQKIGRSDASKAFNVPYNL